MKKMRPHKKGFEPVVGVGCLMASYSYVSRPCSGRRESGVDDRVLHSVRARERDVLKTQLPDFCANLSESV